MLRRLVRDPWAYLGSVLFLGGIAVVLLTLTGCSGMKFSYESGDFQPQNLIHQAGEIAKTVGGITGMPWLDVLGGVLTSLGGSAVLVKRAVKAHDEAPFTPEDAASMDAAKAGQSKPVA